MQSCKTTDSVFLKQKKYEIDMNKTKIYPYLNTILMNILIPGHTSRNKVNKIYLRPAQYFNSAIKLCSQVVKSKSRKYYAIIVKESVSKAIK